MNTWESVISYHPPAARRFRLTGRELLSSSCAAALLAGTGGQAAAQDAQRLWGAWGELGAQAGAETNAFLEGFMPLGQDADSIVFLDMRLDYGENSRGSTSLGLGIREIVGPDLILGANVFVDAVRTENGNTFAGATLGLEAFTSIFDLRINAHVPIGGGTTLSPIVTGDGVSVVNNQLVENRTRTDRKEGLLSGLTGEIGAMFDSPFADNQRLRAYAGGYIYDRGGYDTQTGGRLGLEYQINDVLSLAGSRFTLGAELVYDRDDEFDAIASARLRIPLFAGAQSRDANGESRLSAIQQRMDEGVRRDKGIRVGTSSSTTAVNGVPVINPATGNPFGGVYYADQAGGGTGGFADPTSLATAVANAGTDGIVIALGGGGPITTSGITLQSGQTLIGGGESIQVQLADGSTTNFLLSGTNGTIDGDPGVTTVTLASGVTIRDLTIQGGTTVIGGNAVSNFTLTDLSIQNATDGISVTGAAGANVSNISFSGITGTSLFLNNQSATISNITINGGTNGLSIANNTGTTTLSNINVSNVSGDALSFSNNTGVINVSGFTATNTGDDAIAVTGGGTFGFTGTTTLNGLGAGATSDGIDLGNTNNATLTFGDVDVTGLGGGTGLNMAGADATLTMQSLDVTGTGVAGSKGVDLSGTQNGRTVTVTNGGTITNVDVGLVLGTNGGALAAPDAVFTWGGGDIGGLTYALDGIGVNAANGSYAFGTTGFSGAFNFTTSGTPNYFVAATATGTGDGSSTANRASIATAIGAAGGLGTVNFILIDDGSDIDTAGATFALADNQTIDTFGDGRTFTSAGLIIAANITGTNLPAGTTPITDPTGNGAATLTNSSGAVSTIEVANGNTIRNITLGSTLGTALSGSGIAGLTIEGVTIGTGTDTPVNGIALTNTTGAVTLTNVDITNSTGTGLSLTNASGTVTGNNVDITGSNALSVTGGDADVSFNASSSITNTSGTAVSITNRIGGSFSHFGGIASSGATSGGISIAGATGASNVTFGGQVALGTTTALGNGPGVDIDNNGQASEIAFNGGLEIATTGQTGFSAQGGGSVAVAATGGAETITTAGAMALSLSGIATGTGGITFDSLSSSASGTSGIALTGVTGDAFTVTGTTTVTNAASAGIELSGNTANVAFGATTVTASTTGNGVDISGANTGTISFTDLDVALTGANTVAFDLNGATLGGAVTANDFDVTSTSATGTIGVDLRGLTGGQTVRLGDPSANGDFSSIAGVETGVFLNATSNASFVYGDGEGALNRDSTISATTGIDATNAPVAGTYNFQDVDFAGSPGAGFGIGTIYFVDSDGATGGGDGSGSSAANPMTLADAENLAGAGDIIVLIDNGAAITAAGTNANDTLNLLASQQLLSFGNGAGGSQSIQVSLTVPPTIQLFAAGLTIADPTGGGAATLTTSAGNDVVTLGGDGIRMSGIDFEGNGTAARAVNDGGAGATGTVIERSSVSNFATVGIEITPSTNTTIDDVDFSGNTSDILLNAAGSTLTNITSTGASGTSITLTDATGTTTLSDISITGAANGMSFNNASGTVTATNVDIAGGNTLAIDGGDAVFTFDADSSITTTSGSAASINNRTGGSFTHAGTVVADGPGTGGISSSGATGAHSMSFTGTVDLGLTTALGFSGVAIDNNGQNVTINFADIDVVTDGGFGMLVQIGGTLSVGTGSLAVDNAQIISFGSIAFGAGGVNFTSITGTNVGPVGIGLNTITGGGDFTVTGTTTVSDSAGSAFSLTNVSSDMSFGTVNISVTSDDGLLLDGNTGTLTTGDMTIAMGTAGNGIRAINANGNMTFGNVDITNVGAGTGVNLSGGTFDGQATFATLDIAGTGTAGSKGIDLTDYDNTKNVVTTGSSAIFNVETGIDLTDAVISGGTRFQYGDGSGSNPGTESKIDTTGFAVVTTGMGATGEFDLEDVEFGADLGTTDISNLTGPVVFVVDQNNSSGAGTFSDPGSISEAAAATADVIVLIDTDTGTGTQTVAMAGPLSLDNGQALIGLDSGTTSIDVSTLGISASGAPASLLLTGLGSSSTITSTVTLDSNRLVLNSNSGNTVNLSGSAGIQNVAITNTGTGDGISASFGAAHTLTLRSSSIGGGTGGYAIDVATTTGASSFDFSNLALTSGLRLDGSGGGSLSGTMTGTNTIAGASGQAVALNAVTLDPGGMTFDTISANGGGAVANGIALNNLGGGSSFSVTGTTTLDNFTGHGIELGNLSEATQTINFGAVNINTTVGQVDSGGDGISIDTISATDVDIDFGAVSIGNATDPSGTGVAIATITNAATGFDLDFASLTLTNVGLGFTVDGFDAPGASTVTVAGTTNITANTFDAVRIINSDGDVTFGGRTTITNSGTGATADGVDLGADAGGANTGAYTFNGVDITVNGTDAFGFRATDSGTVTINDPSSNNQITSNNGTALYINPTLISLDLQNVTSGDATGSGVFISGGDAVGGSGASAVDIANLTVTNSAGAGLRITNSTGTFTFGATTINNAGSTGAGVDLDLGAGDTATVNFTGALDIDTDGGTGFDANGAGGTLLTVNVANAGTQAINTATGQILLMNDVTIGGTGVSFDTLEASGTVAGDAVSLANAGGGTFNGGAVTIAGSSGDGIVLANNTATLQFGATNITNAGGDGIDISGSGATFGATTISNPGARGIVIGTTAGATFGDVDITNLANNTTGVDLRSTSGTVSFTTLDISSASVTTGTRGIDLTGATNASNMTTTNASTINNLAIGVDLSGANITGTFQYGDGEGTTNTNSLISNTTTAIVITGVGGTGTFNFEDVAFTGSGTANLAGSSAGDVYWVAATPTGSADGSSAANAGSFASALAATGVGYIVLLDNAGAGQDTINLGTGVFALDPNQSLLSFRVQDTFSFGGGAPPNIQLTGITGGTVINNPNAGSGAPILTSSGTTTLTMSAGSVVDGVDIRNTSGAVSTYVIQAIDINGSMTVQNAFVQAGPSTRGIRIRQESSFSGTTVARIANNTINYNNSRGLDVDIRGAGRVDLTAVNNIIDASTTTGNGITLLLGTVPGSTLCANISNNTITDGSQGIFVDGFVPSGAPATILLQGFTGPADNETEAATFLAGQNTLSGMAIPVQVFLDNTTLPANPAACTVP